MQTNETKRSPSDVSSTCHRTAGPCLPARLSCLVVSCVSIPVVSCRFLCVHPCRVLSCLVCPSLSCHVVSCRVLSCLVCLVVSCVSIPVCVCVRVSLLAAVGGFDWKLIGHARPERYVADAIVPPTIKQKVTMAPGYTGEDGAGAKSEMVVDGDGFTHYKTVAKI